MSNLEQRVKTLELMHEIDVPMTREDVWDPRTVRREKVEDLTLCLQLFNNLEGLPFLDKQHIRKLAKKAIEALEVAQGDIPKYSHKVCEDLIETRKKLEKAEATIRAREEEIINKRCEITRLVNQVNELAGAESSRNLNANHEINVLKDALRSTNAELVELKDWRAGKKGVEDYYKVQEENRKLREHFRYLGFDITHVC